MEGAQDKAEKPKFSFSRLLSSASSAARTLQNAATRALAAPTRAPSQPSVPVQQIAVVAPAPAPSVPDTPVRSKSEEQTTPLKRFDSKTLSPASSRKDLDLSKCPECSAGQQIVAHYQENWARSHDLATTCAGSAAAAHTQIRTNAAYVKASHQRLTTLRTELSHLPDVMAALVQTVQTVDAIRAVLATCEDALKGLAEARLQQSLGAIKSREEKRLETYGRIRHAEAGNAVAHIRAAHARKQRELTRQASVEVVERQRAYEDMFAQQMRHFRLHRKILTETAPSDAASPDNVLPLDTLPEMSDADLAAFLDDAADVAAPSIEGSDDDEDVVPAVVVRCDDEDIDDDTAQRLAAVS